MSPQGLVFHSTPLSSALRKAPLGEDRTILSNVRALAGIRRNRYFLEGEMMVEEYIAEGKRALRRSLLPLSQTNPELFARLAGSAGR